MTHSNKESEMTKEELRELCVLTFELVRLRQNECKHLVVENTAPEILGKLVAEYLRAKGQ